MQISFFFLNFQVNVAEIGCKTICVHINVGLWKKGITTPW